MEPEFLLTILEAPATYPYPESDRSILWPHPASRKYIFFHCSGFIEGSVKILGYCARFVTRLSSYGEELLAPRQRPKLMDHPFSAVRNCLLNIFAATLEAVSPSGTRDASCLVNKDPLVTDNLTIFVKLVCRKNMANVLAQKYIGH
jgi:hypothetical protein